MTAFSTLLNKMPVLLRGLAFLFALYALIGCQFDPYYSLYTTTMPTVSDVAGTYELTYQEMDYYEPSLKAQIKRLALKPRIELLKDGTLRATNFPLFTEGSPHPKFEGFTNFITTYEIGSVGGLSSGVSIYGFVMGTDTAFHQTFQGNPIPNGIIFGHGDPDQGDGLIFDKVK